MGSDDDQRKSRRVPLTLLGASAVTLVALASEPEQISRNIYRTVQDCEAEYGPGRCQANADGTGQSTPPGIATAPGVDFDPVEGWHHVRLSFAVSTDEVREAIARLGPWLKARAG